MTLQELKNERLKNYLECEKKILINQSYTVEGRTYTRANLQTVRKMIDDLLASGATLDETGEYKNNNTARIVFVE